MPQYEWLVTELGGHIALFNAVQGDYLVYAKRRYGINLRWREDVNRRFFGEQTTTVPLPEQSLFTDFPHYYRARFGAAIKGIVRNLKFVTTTPETPEDFLGTAMFLKRGRRPSECVTPNPDAVVGVGLGRTLTAAELKTLVGSATPRLPVTFRACLGLGPPIEFMHLRVTYLRAG